MKVTKSYVQQIIKEELEKTLTESDLQQEGWKELAKSLKYGFKQGKEAGEEAEKAAKEKYVEDPEAMTSREASGTLAKLKAGIGSGFKSAKEKYGQEMSDKKASEEEVAAAIKAMEEPGESAVMKTASRAISDLKPIKKQYENIMKKYGSTLGYKGLFNIFTDLMNDIGDAEIYSNYSQFRKNPNVFQKQRKSGVSKFPASKVSGVGEG